MPPSYRTGGKPPVRYDVRRIAVVIFIVIALIFIVDKLIIHRRNHFEATADAITKAIANNDMRPVEHAFNAINRSQLEDRARVGHLSDLVVAMGAFKGSKEDTPAGSPTGYHHFTERFAKGTLVEKYQLDADGKIERFHIGPSETQ